ncbi:MAG: hypothetical protein CMJ36_03560 [Phycisphaerae bacterium]|nr:hypothetical protein [Phycisphaerae bacterium]
MRPAASSSHRRGFTMVEIIMVCVILALLLSAILVRLTSLQGRNFDTVVDQAGDLLMMYALRSEHARQPVGLFVDESRSSIRLMRRESGDDPGDTSLWKSDPTVREVRLPDFMSIYELEIYIDGDQADLTQWPLSTMPGEDRPAVEIVLYHEDREVRLNLPPTALAPVRIEDGRDTLPVREMEDLDTTGRWQEDW